MTRSQSISSTIIPVATLVLGIAIGWRLGPEPAFQTGPDTGGENAVALADSNQNAFAAASESGDAAVIGSISESLADEEVGSSGFFSRDEVQYFPEAIAEDAASRDEELSTPRQATAGPDGQNPVEPFDEEVWRAELTGLTDDQADELVEIKKRLGNVAAQSLGVESESFPSLPGQALASNADRAEPRLLTLPDDGPIRPAIELASGEDSLASPNAVVAEVSAVAATEAGKTLAGNTGKAPTDDASLNPSIAQFRSAVEATLRLNLRNQKTPGYRRAEVVVVGVENVPASGIYSGVTDTAGSSGEVPDNIQAARGNRVSWLTRLDARPGQQILTGNPFDVAIFDAGWLMVQHGERRCVTRTGLLCRTKDGRLGLRTPEGPLPLVPEILIPDAPAGWMSISDDGNVTITSPSDEGSEEPHVVGRIVPVCFPNESALERLPSGLLVETTESGPAFEDSDVELQQGYLESSSVDPARERATAEELLQFADQLELNR